MRPFNSRGPRVVIGLLIMPGFVMGWAIGRVVVGSGLGHW